jgi:hypothetical protein
LGRAETDSNGNATFIPATSIANITFPNIGTYYVYVKTETYVSVPSGFSLTKNVTLNNTTNTFTIVLNKIDITDQGILVIGDSNNYARMQRVQSGDVLTIKGNSEFIGDGGSNITNQTLRLANGGIFIGGGTPLVAAGYTLRINSLPGLGNAGANTQAVRWEPTNKRLYYSTSSRRFKKDIGVWKPSDVLTKINLVDTVKFRYNDASNESDLILGMIAEDLHDNGFIEVVNYEIVSGSKIPHNIDFEKVSVILWKGLQELSKKVTDLENIISGSNNL